MTKFMIGVVVERTQSADLIVAVEAETQDAAEKIALQKVASLKGEDMRSAMKSINRNGEWQTEERLIVDGISDEDYSDGFNCDLDLTEE